MSDTKIWLLSECVPLKLVERVNVQHRKKKRGLKNEAEVKFKATAVTVVMANTLLTLFIFATSSGFDTQRASFTLNLLCVAVAQASRRQP